jgi:hypothetical protein
LTVMRSNGFWRRRTSGGRGSRPPSVDEAAADVMDARHLTGLNGDVGRLDPALGEDGFDRLRPPARGSIPTPRRPGGWTSRSPTWPSSLLLTPLRNRAGVIPAPTFCWRFGLRVGGVHHALDGNRLHLQAGAVAASAIVSMTKPGSPRCREPRLPFPSRGGPGPGLSGEAHVAEGGAPRRSSPRARASTHCLIWAARP